MRKLSSSTEIPQKKEQIKNVLLSKFKKGLSMLFFLIQCKQ